VGRLTALKPRVSQVKAPVQSRTTATERTRGRKWMRIREGVLRANPLCVECQRRGELAAAAEVDHVVALADGGTDDLLQSLCKTCHDAKSAAEANARAGRR